VASDEVAKGNKEDADSKYIVDKKWKPRSKFNIFTGQSLITTCTANSGPYRISSATPTSVIPSRSGKPSPL